MPVPVFTVGEVLTAANMNAVGLWRVTGCTVTSVGGTAATASNGVITVGNGNTSVTVSNAFSADFDNYRIIFNGFGASVGGQSIKFQLSASTGTTYSMGGLYTTFGSATLNGYGPAATTSWTDPLPLDTSSNGGHMDIYQPHLTRQTFFTSMGVREGTNSDGWYMMTGQDTSTASSTGFVISPISGSFTGGTVRVYGYRN